MRRSIAAAVCGLIFCSIVAAPSAVAATETEGSPCAICINQVGNDNNVTLDVEGERNAVGGLGSVVSSGLTVLGSAPGTAQADPITVPLMRSGAVTQQGSGNRAGVLVRGDDNEFHVEQQGDRNLAVQVVLGDRNETSSLQGADSLDSDNSSLQLEVGSDNRNYISQSGSRNVALTQQVPTAELALLGLGGVQSINSVIAAVGGGAFSGAAGGNSILLEQNNGDNEAVLTQIGSGHSIALRQEGNAQISITQLGAAKSVAIQQSAGSQGVQVLQY